MNDSQHRFYIGEIQECRRQNNQPRALDIIAILWQEFEGDAKKLAAKHCVRFARGVYDFDDFVSCAKVHFMRQIHRFDLKHEGNAMVRTWVYTILDRKIRDEARRIRRIEIPREGEGDYIQVGFRAERNDAIETVRAILAAMARDQQSAKMTTRNSLSRVKKVLAFQLHFLEGQTYDEIKVILGVSKTSVSKAIAEIKKEFTTRFLESFPSYAGSPE